MVVVEENLHYNIHYSYDYTFDDMPINLQFLLPYSIKIVHCNLTLL